MNWSKFDSIEEEIIGVLWLILSAICFGFGFTFFGWITLIKGLVDQAGAIALAIRENREDETKHTST